MINPKRLANIENQRRLSDQAGRARRLSDEMGRARRLSDEVGRARRLSELSGRERERRLSSLPGRERGAVTAHEDRHTAERERRLEFEASEKRRVSDAVDGPFRHRRLSLASERRDRRRSSVSKRRRRRKKSSVPENEPKAVGGSKLAVKEPKRVESSKEAESGNVFPEPKKVTKAVRISSKMPQVMEKANEPSSEDSEGSGSESDSEPEHPFKVPPVPEVKKKPNLISHYHHKDGRRDSIFDPNEVDLKTIYQCSTLHKLREADFKDYEREQREQVRDRDLRDAKVAEFQQQHQKDLIMQNAARFRTRKAVHMRLHEHKVDGVSTSSRLTVHPGRAPSRVAPGLRILNRIDMIFLKHSRYEREGCCDSTNVYRFVNKHGHLLFRVVEEVKRGGCFGRCKFVSYSCYNDLGQELVMITKNFECGRVRKRLRVYSPPENLIGYVEEKRTLFQPQVEVKDPKGDTHVLIELEPYACPCCTLGCGTSMFLRNKIFSIKTLHGAPRGRIREDWTPGPLKHFGANFPGNMDITLKTLIMAASIIVYERHFDTREVMTLKEDPVRGPSDSPPLTPGDFDE